MAYAVLLLLALTNPAGGGEGPLPRWERIPLLLPENLSGAGGFPPVEIPEEAPPSAWPRWESRSRFLGEDRRVLGEVVQILPATGETLVRPVLWERRGGGWKGRWLPGLPRRRLHLEGLGPGGRVFGWAEAGRGRFLPVLIQGKRVDRPLDDRLPDGWRPRAMAANGLLVGDAPPARGGGAGRLVLLLEGRNGRRDHRLLPLPGEPRAVTASGWIAGRTADGRPFVLGPVLDRGRLRRQEALEALEPLPWPGTPPLGGLLALGEDGRALAEGGPLGGSLFYGEPLLDPSAGLLREAAAVPLPFRAAGWSRDGWVAGTSGAVAEAGAGNRLESRGMIWSGGRTESLDARLSGAREWRILSVAGVDERGWIAATAARRLEDSTETVVQACLLRPR